MASGDFFKQQNFWNFLPPADSLCQIILRKVHPLGSLSATPYTEEKLALRHIKFLTFNLAFLALKMKFHVSVMKNMTAYLIVFESLTLFPFSSQQREMENLKRYFKTLSFSLTHCTDIWHRGEIELATSSFSSWPW